MSSSTSRQEVTFVLEAKTIIQYQWFNRGTTILFAYAPIAKEVFPTTNRLVLLFERQKPQFL
jgi:hypothetical protein